jgi:outer membrane protein TolC
MIQSQEELAAKSVDLQKWAYYPTVAAYYSYRYKLLTSGFDLSPNHAAGLSVSVPIFTGLQTKAKVSQAKIELDKASRTKALVEEQLMLQNGQLSFELTNAWENYNTQKENVEVAKRFYQNVDNKYRQGMVSSLDLTQANTNYLTAESNYVSAILTLLQADLKLKKLYNKL